MKIFLLIILFFFCFAGYAGAKEFLPKNIIKNTIVITATATGEIGKNYFYCTNGKKCSTEQVAREYYENNGYKIMRAEYSFWKGIFTLAFLDELYPQTLNNNGKGRFFDKEKDNVDFQELNKKLKLIKKTNTKEFINNQIAKHENGAYIRWLD